MGMYTNSQGYTQADFETVDVNMEELQEAYFYDEFGSESDAVKKAFFESADVVLEKGKISKKTIVRLNKNDDLSRRTTMAALQLAKDANDKLWKALVGNRVKERQLLGMINKKYGSRAGIVAKAAQRDYIKGDNRSKMLRAKDIAHRD